MAIQVEANSPPPYGVHKGHDLSARKTEDFGYPGVNKRRRDLFGVGRQEIHLTLKNPDQSPRVAHQ
jgi:hypothetical protein